MKTLKLFLMSALLFAIVFCFAGSAKAMTDIEKQALITQLQAEIVQLQAQIAQLEQSQSQQTTTTGASWCHDFNTNMKAGATGSEVLALQTALTKEGYDVSADKKMTFEDATYVAVVKFQERYASETLAPYGLTSGTGAVSSKTRAKLNALYGCALTSVQASSPTQPSITITSPNGGESWTQGTTQSITWQANGVDKVDITVSHWGPTPVIVDIAKGVDASLGTYAWKVPSDLIGNDFIVSVDSVKDGNYIAQDFSDNYFSIVNFTKGAVNIYDKENDLVSSLKPALPMFKGKEYKITWQYDQQKLGIDPSQLINIQLISFDYGFNTSQPATFYYTIADDIPINLGSYTFTLPKDLKAGSTAINIDPELLKQSYDYNIVIYLKDKYSALNDKEFARSNLFKIVSYDYQYVSILSPVGGETWQGGETYNIKWKSVNYDEFDFYNSTVGEVVSVVCDCPIVKCFGGLLLIEEF